MQEVLTWATPSRRSLRGIIVREFEDDGGTVDVDEAGGSRIVVKPSTEEFLGSSTSSAFAKRNYVLIIGLLGPTRRTH